MPGHIEIVRADQLHIGDMFSTDGYTVEAAVILPGGGVDGEVFVQVRREDDPRVKSAYLPLDYPCPLWREDDPATWTIPADGFSDGGTPYSDEEMEVRP